MHVWVLRFPIILKTTLSSCISNKSHCSKSFIDVPTFYSIVAIKLISPNLFAKVLFIFEYLLISFILSIYSLILLSLFWYFHIFRMIVMKNLIKHPWWNPGKPLSFLRRFYVCSNSINFLDMCHIIFFVFFIFLFIFLESSLEFLQIKSIECMLHIGKVWWIKRLCHFIKILFNEIINFLLNTFHIIFFSMNC